MCDDDRFPDRDAARDRSEDPRGRDRDARGHGARPRPQPGWDRLGDEREHVRYRGRDYHLNEADARLLRTVGRYRAVYTDHLRDRHPSLDYQVRQLREQDLLEAARIHIPDGRRSADVLALTREGQRLVSGAEEGQQRYYGGLVQPRELHHNAHLYRLVEQEEQRLEERGARVERVLLDAELRRQWWSRDLADIEPVDRAERIGIGLDDNGRALFPDVQIEIREADDTVSRCNLELVTEHYSRAAVRAKARAGFRMFRLGRNSQGRGGIGPDRDDGWAGILDL